MKEKNGFTLIELLAIIVILAIIAVITVPIILNIIENSRKGAASDSAYGFKDAVNKYYVQELANNNSLKLQGEYSVSNGVLNGTGFSNVEIPLSGTKPSSGKLHYTNNVLDDGCLVIGDYKIIFKSDGSINETVKGNCDDYVVSGGSEQGGSSSNEQSGDPALVNYTMNEMCPDCIFSNQTVGGDFLNQNIVINNESSYIIDDYTEWNENFLGYIVENNIIKRAFACGSIEVGETRKYFCVEGTSDGSKYNRNLQIIQHFFPECNINSNSEQVQCGNSAVMVKSDGYAETDGYYHCIVDNSSEDGIICY